MTPGPPPLLDTQSNGLAGDATGVDLRRNKLR